MQIRELALECGYNAASIRERIYADVEDGRDQAGFLIYTAAADSDGTLGGLVELGKPENLGRLLRQALDRAHICASDPLSAGHDPSKDQSLHGAACHACSFVSETSCERENRHLDRSLVVPSRQGDSPILPELLSQIPATEDIETVTADGACDTRRCHAAILQHGPEPIIPIRRNGRAWEPDCPAAISRNEILRATRCLGRALWKKWAGYHVRSRVEAQMNRLKLFGERIMSRDPDRQTAEIQIRIIRHCRSDQWRDIAHS
ncbi:transposase [Rhodovulum sulfidophilum]|nr:transposase [Rhodovulum sulfidophilum]OLS48308.1 hypothetical protein BV379_08465 [Rhodovulum sulfidophilum]